MATQTPALQSVFSSLERLMEQNGLLKLMGLLLVLERGGQGGPEGAHHSRGRGRERGPHLRGILFSGCGRTEIVYEDRPLRHWLQEASEEDTRDRAIEVLVKAMSDRELIQREGITVGVAGSLREARALFKGELPDLVLLDLALPNSGCIEAIRDLGARTEIEVVMSGENGSVSAADSVPADAFDYLSGAPEGPGTENVSSYLDVHEFREESGTLQKKACKRSRFGPMVGGSQPMQSVYDLINRVAPTEATVLITGESGTGKELVAQALHAASRRSKRPFFTVNCGSFPPNLIDSELFGHEQGSFTGAHHMHKGHFERANGGTIFLDEITEMPLELQVKLLRVLEYGSFMRVGGDQQVTVDVRVIAATNRRLEDAVTDGKLREDLLYRLNVFPIHLPPLRDRRDDIDLLADHFLAELNRIESLTKRFTRAALDRLRVYHWPGNVRELKNVIQRAFILADEKITAECLPREVGGKEGPVESDLHLKVGTPLAEAERRLILATFDQCDGNKMKTAEVLGISLRTLYNRLDSYWNRDEAGETKSQKTLVAAGKA